MVCHLCMDTLPFLYAYLSPHRLKALIDAAIPMPCTADAKPSCQTEKEVKESSKPLLEGDTVDILTVDGEEPSPKKQKLEDNGPSEANQASEQTDIIKEESPGKSLCKLTYHWTTVGDRKLEQDAFFDEGWRSSLCSCPDCKVQNTFYILEFKFCDINMCFW